MTLRWFSPTLGTWNEINTTVDWIISYWPLGGRIAYRDRKHSKCINCVSTAFASFSSFSIMHNPVAHIHCRCGSLFQLVFQTAFLYKVYGFHFEGCVVNVLGTQNGTHILASLLEKWKSDYTGWHGGERLGLVLACLWGGISPATGQEFKAVVGLQEADGPLSLDIWPCLLPCLVWWMMLFLKGCFLDRHALN